MGICVSINIFTVPSGAQNPHTNRNNALPNVLYVICMQFSKVRDFLLIHLSAAARRLYAVPVRAVQCRAKTTHQLPRADDRHQVPYPILPASDSARYTLPNTVGYDIKYHTYIHPQSARIK